MKNFEIVNDIDPNAYNASAIAYRRAINRCQDLIERQQRELNEQQNMLKMQQDAIEELQRQNRNVQMEFEKVINSKGWKMLEKTRKIMLLGRNSVVDNGVKKDTDTTKSDEEKSDGTLILGDAADRTDDGVVIKATYNSHYEDNFDYSALGYKPEVKALAFYLPQFHTFPENDRWWGKGFTEWTNTKKAKPRFEGHYQPREPHVDIGYYTLDNVETIKKQVILARQHGIYGFCFYYYWFSGKRLMKKPIDLFLDGSIDFPFCLCWANENWTRRWDGKNQDILIEQKYEKDDPVKFIRDIKKYLLDKRYIRVDGRPVIMVYEPDSIPDFEKVVDEWREEARKIGIGEILIWSKSTIQRNISENAEYVDAEFDFAPVGHGTYLMGEQIEVNKQHCYFDYAKTVDDLAEKRIYYNHVPLKPFYYSCTMGWDNSARKKNDYWVLGNYSPEKFYDWLSLIIEETKRRFPKDKRFVFINAWNEWAEGTYLEPDKKFGYTNINAAAKAIYGLPYDTKNVVVLNDKSEKSKDRKRKIAVQVHAFYPDIFEELFDNLENIPTNFDLYVSTDTDHKKEKIRDIIETKNMKVKKLEIEVFDNVGRDVYPLLKQFGQVYKDYDIISHFHTKRTLTEYRGDDWRKYIYRNLLDSPENIERIMALLEKQEVGLVTSTDFKGIPHSLTIGSNFEMVNSLLRKVGLREYTDADRQIRFPVGTMFWAKTEAIEKILKMKLDEKDFLAERGQTDGTLAHAMERLFGVVPELLGYEILEVINKSGDV